MNEIIIVGSVAPEAIEVRRKRRIGLIVNRLEAEAQEQDRREQRYRDQRMAQVKKQLRGSQPSNWIDELIFRACAVLAVVAFFGLLFYG